MIMQRYVDKLSRMQCWKQDRKYEADMKRFRKCNIHLLRVPERVE